MNLVYLGFSTAFILLNSSAFGLPCAPASTPLRLASPPFGHAACLGLAKIMPLAGCVLECQCCKAMMTGEAECKGGPTDGPTGGGIFAR